MVRLRGLLLSVVKRNLGKIMSKRKLVWVGKGQLITPKTDASTPVGEIMELVPAVLEGAPGGENTRCVIDAIYLHFSVTRIGINRLDAVGFMVWVARVGEAANTPVQSMDALSLRDRVYANKAILMMAPLPVPPILGASDLLSFLPNDQVAVAHHDFQASRKLDRSNEVLALVVNSDVSSEVEVFVQARVLLSYGS